MSYSILFVMLAVLFQGGNGDMLNNVSTDGFWKTKGVAPTAQVLEPMAQSPGKTDITQEINQLSQATGREKLLAMNEIIAAGEAALPQLQELAKSTDPKLTRLAAELQQQIARKSQAGAIRQLMAIRTLGEIKSRQSLPLLQGLLQSKQAFVAEYAARAIARIDGKPFTIPMATAADLEKDYLLLLANCGLIAQLQTQSNPLPVAVPVPATSPATTQAADSALNVASRQILTLLEQSGDIRLDCLTLGVSEQVGPNEGMVMLVMRGDFDRARVINLLTKQGMRPTTQDGNTLFPLPFTSGLLIFAQDGRIIFLIDPHNKEQLAIDILASLKTGTGTLNSNQPMMQLLSQLDKTQSLWVAIRMTDSYRQLPMPFPVSFDTLLLLGKRSSDGLALELTANGKADPATLQADVKLYQDQISQGIAGLQEVAQRHPTAKLALSFLQSIEFKQQNSQLVVTAKLLTTGLSLPQMMGL